MATTPTEKWQERIAAGNKYRDEQVAETEARIEALRLEIGRLEKHAATWRSISPLDALEAQAQDTAAERRLAEATETARWRERSEAEYQESERTFSQVTTQTCVFAALMGACAVSNDVIDGYRSYFVGAAVAFGIAVCCALVVFPALTAKPPSR